MFEDFEGSTTLYRKESSMVNRLTKLKLGLYNLKAKISLYLDESKHDKIHKCSDLRHTLHENYNYSLVTKETIATETSKYFPASNPYDGAIKAMFILQYSYAVNMYTVRRGTIWRWS